MRKGQKHPGGWKWNDAARERIRARSAPKAAVMAAMYRNGYTLEQIGKQYGVTREYIRQLIKKYHGLTGKDGGQRTDAARKRKSATEARDARYLKSMGCAFEQYKELRELGREQMAGGIHRDRTPLGAFARQRHNASTRGIAWELKLWEWWTIWQRSGRWEQRGRGQGYCMCRRGDIGPYSADNVFIDLMAHNSSEQCRKKSGLPIGVRKNKRCRGYTAFRSINGKKLRLGSFPTPELAHAAYLMAGENTRAAA